MGQAKQRGSYEERVAMAKLRQEELLQKIDALPAQVKKRYKNQPPRRILAALFAAGLISRP